MVANQPRNLSRSKVHEAHQPDDRCRERRHKQEKNHPPFPSLFAQWTMPLSAPIVVSKAFVLQCKRDIQSIAARFGSHMHLLSLPRYYAGALRASREVPLPVFLSLLACGEAPKAI
jgi:hypothetical protein